ncbi:MAG: HlyD family secretion protein [Nitrospirota bacterium]
MEETKEAANNHRRKKIAIIVFSLIAVIGAVILYFYLGYKATHITTDDAFIDGSIYTVASKVPGTVKSIQVRDNQPVREGDILAEIDDVDYDVRVKEGEAGLSAERSKLAEILTKIEVAKKQLSESKFSVESARANLELQEANLKQAEIDVKRSESLFGKGAVSKERYEKTKTGYNVALAQVKAAKEQLRQAEASLETRNAIIRQAESTLKSQASVVRQREALLKAAELNKAYTKIYAPSDGYITKKSVETGNRIEAGQPLMAVVSLNDLYVTANYKETQLEKVKPGQKAEIKVDTYPGKVFMGKVESIMAGTGAVFSLFPPENATGNYVKVVQRIPVKIILDKDTDRDHVLRIGMSVIPTIIIKD